MSFLVSVGRDWCITPHRTKLLWLIGNQDFARSALQLACTLGRQLSDMRKALVAGKTIFGAHFAKLYFIILYFICIVFFFSIPFSAMFVSLQDHRSHICCFLSKGWTLTQTYPQQKQYSSMLGQELSSDKGTSKLSKIWQVDTSSKYISYYKLYKCFDQICEMIRLPTLAVR